MNIVSGTINRYSRVGLSLLLACLLWGDLALAVDEIEFNIPSQKASQALTLFARTADIPILFPSKELRNITTNALHGRYTVEQGLEILLKDTGLLVKRGPFNQLMVKHKLSDKEGVSVSKLQKKKTIIGGLTAFLASAFTSSPIIAQEEQTNVLEEVIVSARKKEESLQDVPISISAFTGEQIKSAGIQRLEYLAPSIPNFHHAQVPTGSDQFFMRGVGSGNNFGFEMAVGQVIDGFYYGRSKIGRAAFLDLARVEVLKGPQGAILGKNNSAGALLLTTAKPTDQFEASITGNWQFEGNEGYNVETFISGPMSDSVKGRLVIRYDETDGYIDNLALDEDEQSTDDISARGTLVWDVNEDVEVIASYQHVDFDRKGISREIFNCGPVLQGMLSAPPFQNQAECKINYKTLVNGPVNGVPTQDFFEQEQDMYHLTVNWDLGDHMFSSLTGFMEYDFEDAFDGDSTPTENRSFGGVEEYEQLLQEFRLYSTGGGAIDYTVGAFFLNTEQETDFLIHFAAVGTPGTRVISSKQDSTTWAVFGELTWHITDTLDLTLGGRYTDEEKELEQEQHGAVLYSSIPMDFTGGPAGNEHVISPDRSETNFSPTLDLQWRPNDNIMLYGSIRRGFKGGGFNMFLNAPQATALDLVEFEEEEVTSYEVGAKMDLWENTARLNIAAFRSEFDDLQQSVFVSFGTFQVGNASSAITQGIEAGFDWQPIEGLLLKADLAYLDAEWDDYDPAPCYAAQNAATGCTSRPALGLGRAQDLSGEDLYNAPEVSAALSATYTWSLTDDLELTGFLQVTHRGDHSIASDNDPVLHQDSYQMVNGRLALANASGSWEVALVGRNLGDETVMNNGSDTSPDSFAAFLLPPRVLGLQATLRY